MLKEWEYDFAQLRDLESLIVRFTVNMGPKAKIQ
jgi:hypothetical protein